MAKTRKTASRARIGKHRSAAEWRSLIRAHDRSGLTQVAFCEREGGSTQSLLNWRKRLRPEASRDVEAPTVTAPPAFLEIGQSIGPLDSGVKVRIELGAGVVLGAVESLMVTPPHGVRVFLCTQATDMRKSFDGLIAATKSVIGENPLLGHLFVFVNRKPCRTT